MKKLVIIPAYNEKDSIVNTVKDIKDNAQGFDYIVVNDGSTDNSRAILESYDTFLVLAGDIYQIESIEFGNWWSCTDRIFICVSEWI